jgi:RNA polymerase sigma-70 factor (ECF subfamily)
MSSSADTASDADLLAALPDDVAAFETFYRRHVEQVAARAARRCGNADDVADVVALTFVRLLDVAPGFDPARGAPRSFLFGIADNVAREVRRTSARQRAVVWKLTGRELLDGDDVERIDARIDAAAAAGHVRAALGEVPAGEQQMLRLVADGMTPGQASDALGISPQAGWARLSRARRRVRRQVANPTGEHHDH